MPCFFLRLTAPPDDLPAIADGVRSLLGDDATSLVPFHCRIDLEEFRVDVQFGSDTITPHELASLLEPYSMWVRVCEAPDAIDAIYYWGAVRSRQVGPTEPCTYGCDDLRVLMPPGSAPPERWIHPPAVAQEC